MIVGKNSASNKSRCFGKIKIEFPKKFEPTPINKSFNINPLKILPKLNTKREKIIKPEDSWEYWTIDLGALDRIIKKLNILIEMNKML